MIDLLWGELILAMAIVSASLVNRLLPRAWMRHAVWCGAVAVALTGPARATDVWPARLTVAIPVAVLHETDTIEGGSRASAAPEAAFPPPRRSPAKAAILALWAAGAIVCAGRQLLANRSALRLRARARPITDLGWFSALRAAGSALGTRARPPILACPDVEIPVVVGLWRPAIIVPASMMEWAPRKRDLVLLHELAHVARRDPIVRVLAELARALHWWDPLMWHAALRLSIEAERAVDDAVLRAGAQPYFYASLLLDFANAPYDDPVPALLQRATLKERILGIVADRRVTAAPTLRAALLTLAPIGATVLLLLSLHPLAATTPTPRGAIQSSPASSQRPVAPPKRAPASTSLAAAEPHRGQVLRVEPVESVVDPVAALISTALSDPSPHVRVAAIHSLGRIGDPRARPALERLRGDDDPGIRRETSWSLDRLPLHR